MTVADTIRNILLKSQIMLLCHIVSNTGKIVELVHYSNIYPNMARLTMVSTLVCYKSRYY